MAMQDEPRSETVELPESTEVHAYRGFWWMLGFRRPKQHQQQQVVTSVSSPARQCLTGHKRIHPVTRLMLNILPRWVQGALGYPVSTAIGCSLSPEIRVSPTKPCGKGSKRKQDDLDDDDEDEEHQSWVEALTQEIVDEGPEKDPDYEPDTDETETDSEEFRSYDMESDHEEGTIIEDV
ncbi:oogenesis-related isoform X2 [Festucalex cinctus]